MDAAERLFAERGIDAVSLRTINTEAGYSVAALHYHFGTRDGLVKALLQRAQPAMFQQRATMVAALEAQAHPPIEAIVKALVYPLTAGMLENFARRGPVALPRASVFRPLAHQQETLEDGVALFRPLLRAPCRTWMRGP